MVKGQKKNKTRASKRLGLEAVPGSGLRFSVGDMHCRGEDRGESKQGSSQDYVRIERQVSGAARTTAQLNSVEKILSEVFYRRKQIVID